MASLIGKEISKYRITERIGRGGMADVYLGIHTHLDRKVAIKVLHSHLLEGGDFVARFKREAKAVANLRHPNIVQVYDFDIQDDLIFMVMEYIDGTSLHAKLVEAGNQGERLPIKLIGSIINDIASALDYAHAKGMLHRDIKPSNILLDKNNKAYLTDFGIAKLLDDQKFTATGQLVGTPAYMSPEQGLGEELTEESDIYSLGIVAFEMLTGQVPYDAKTPIAIVHKQINDPVPDLSDLVDGMPGTAQEVLNRALAKTPGGRYNTAEALVSALKTALNALESTEPLVAAEPESAPQQEVLDAPTLTMQDEELGKSTVVMEVEKPTAVPEPAPAPAAQKPPKKAKPQVEGPKKKIPVWVFIAGGVILLGGIAAVLTQVLDLGGSGGGGSSDPTAVEVFISPEQTDQGITIMNDVPDGNYEVVTIEKAQAFGSGNHRALDAPDGNQEWDGYLYFDISDDILYALPAGSQATVFVIFLDQGTDSFDLQYDAHFGGDFGDGRFKIGGILTKTGTGEFKTAQFNLADVYFANRNNGADIRISDVGDGPETIQSIRVIWTLPEEAAPAAEGEPSLEGEALFNQAQELFDNGEFPGAIDTAMLSLNTGYETVEVYHLIGRSYHMLGECSQALAYLDTALELEPDYYWSLYHRGNCQNELGNLAAAIEDLIHATQADPDNQAAWSSLAQVYYTSDQDRYLEDGLMAATRAIELQPENYESRLIRGSLLMQAEDYQAALEDLNIAVELAPPDAVSVFNMRGLLYLTLGQYEPCIADYSVFAERDPDNPWAYLERGDCFYGLGDFGAARGDYEHFLEMTAMEPGSWADPRNRAQNLLDTMP